MKKWMKRTLVAVAVILVIVLIAGFAAGNYMYNLALNPASDKSMVLGAEHNTTARNTDASTEAVYGENQAWFEAQGYEDRYIQSQDGLRLHAYAIENDGQENRRWAILCHGYGGHGGQMLYSAKRFHDMGYGVLMPDARGLGQSEGDYIGMGWPERLDIVQWIDALLQEEPDAQVVLFGVSMGGATVMMTAGETLPSNVKAIVEDCGYSSVWDEFAYQLKQLFGLPSFPVLGFASLVAQMRAGYGFGEASAVKQVAKTETPILFIHGGNDTFVPTDMVYQVYEAAAGPKALYVVDGAGHGAAASVAGEAYWDTVWDFLDGYVD